MADQPVEWREIPYERLFPWIPIFRTVRIALDSKKLIVATLALFAVDIGWTRLFPARATAAPLSGLSEPLAFPTEWAHVPAYFWLLPARVAEPALIVVGSCVEMFRTDIDRRQFVHALLRAVWALVVWSLAAGVLTRMAVAQSARRERTSLRASARFAFRRCVTLVGSPLCPFLFVGLLVLFVYVPIGLIYRAESVLSVTSAVLGVPALLVALLMANVLVGLALAWPLMPPAVAADEGDGFDALSRSYAYVNQRRIYFLALVVLAWVIGMAGLVFVDLLARLVVELTQWALSFSASGPAIERLFHEGAPNVPMGTAPVHSFWLALVATLAHAWIYSFFWSAAAVIYLVLRHDVDGTPFQDLAWSEAKPSFSAGDVGVPPPPPATSGAFTSPDAPSSPRDQT
jgi:hypothetical protein